MLFKAPLLHAYPSEEHVRIANLRTSHTRMIADTTHEERLAQKLARSLEQQKALNLILHAIQAAQTPTQVLEVAIDDVIQVFATGKDRHVTFGHGADDGEVGLCAVSLAITAQYLEQAGHMAIGMGFENIRLAQRRDAVSEHAGSGALDQIDREVEVEVLTAGDPVDAVGGEKTRPFLEPVLVDAMGIIRHQPVDTQPQRQIAMHEPEHWGIVEFREDAVDTSVEPLAEDAGAWHLRFASYHLAAHFEKHLRPFVAPDAEGSRR